MTTKLTTKGTSSIVGTKDQIPMQTSLTRITTKTGKVVAQDNKVDIVFVIDTTGSMDDKIEGLLCTCRQFTDEAKNIELDPQYALISFGDVSVVGGGDKIDVVVPLTENLERVKDGLSHIPRNNGFGNDGETPFEAIREALKLKYRSNAVKVLILITDEPAIQRKISAETIIHQLCTLEFLVFVIATEHEYYKHLASRNGGVWKKIGVNTDLSEILDIFREMARKVSKIAKDVHVLGKGSVKEYLRLKAPDSNTGSTSETH